MERPIKLIPCCLIFLAFSLASPGFAAQIRGQVALTGGEDPAGTGIALFDGFSVREDTADKEGRFAVDSGSATEGVVLYVARPGYRPETRHLSLKDPVLPFSIRLEKMDDLKKGIVVGSVYTPISGGKRSPHFGVRGMIPNETIVLKGEGGRFEVRTDTDGRFLLEVPPGRYLLEGGIHVYSIVVSPGETTIQNIPKGRVLVD
jgi:hypothetical protein